MSLERVYTEDVTHILMNIVNIICPHFTYINESVSRNHSLIINTLFKSE